MQQETQLSPRDCTSVAHSTGTGSK